MSHPRAILGGFLPHSPCCLGYCARRRVRRIGGGEREMTAARVLVRSVVGAAACLAGALALAGPVAAQEAPVSAEAQGAALTVTVHPATAGLASGSETSVVVVMKNGGRTSATDVAIQWRGSTELTVLPAQSAIGDLAPGASAEAAFTAQRPDHHRGETQAIATVSYRDVASGADRVEVATLVVTDGPDAAAPPSVLTVTAEAAVTELQQYRSTDLILTVTNGTPLTVTGIEVTVPSFVSVEHRGAEALSGSESPFVVDLDRSLDPGSAVVFVFHLEIEQALQPGKAFVGFVVTASDDRGDTVSAATSTSIDFAVLGESAFLDAVGAPSLYLVPGLVMGVVVWLAYTRMYPRFAAGGASLPLETKVLFWVFAALPSLALPFLYPALTDLVGPERDYRRAYGLDDILFIWLLAATIGILLWAIPVGCAKVFQRLFLPAAADAPMQVLWKLARRGPFASLERPVAVHASRSVRILRHLWSDRLLVTPVIEYQPPHAKVSTSIAKDRPIRCVVRLAWQRRFHEMTVQYAAGARPVDADDASVTARTAAQSIVEEKS